MQKTDFSAEQKSALGDIYDPANTAKQPAAPSVMSKSQARRMATIQPKPKIVDDLDLTK